MFNTLVITAVTLSLVITSIYGASGTRFNVIEGDASEKYEHLVSENIEDTIGFSVSDPHERINIAYENKYGDKESSDYDNDWELTLDNLGSFAMTNDRALNPLLKIAPELAAFSPFNQSIYKKVSENKTYIGHLDPTTMLDIVGIEDEGIREDFVAMFDPLDKWTTEELGGMVEISTFEALPAKTMMQFEIPVDRSSGLSDFIEVFQEKYETAFEDKGYIIAGFKNFKESYEDIEMPFDEYDSFFVYSICHFTFSYNIFNKGRPDAGVFAPCSMYAYIKKGSNTMVMGMPTVANWSAVMNIKDPAKLEWIEKIDIEIVEIMKSLGATEI